MPAKNRTVTGVLGGFLGLIGLSAIAGLLVTATVTPAIALTSNAASSAINMFDKLPSYLDIDALMLPTTLYAKDSKTGKYVEMTSFYDQNRSPVSFDEIAPVMYDAILSSEDPRFYQHGGIDLIGTARAVLQNMRGGGETQGGSSISQQYVKNVLVQKCEWNAADEEAARNCFLEATTAEGSEGYQRKLQEMRYAIALEQRYSKNDILLGYLNIANFGGTNYGIDAAAKFYFGVSAANLSLGQAATLAGMVQNPNNIRIDQPGGSFYHPSTDSYTNSAEDGYADTTTRRNYVLDRMLAEGKITAEQHDAAKAEAITPNITQPKTGCANSTAPYFCQYVRATIANDPAFGATAEDRQKALKQGGLQVYTSLDLQLQATTDKAMDKYTPTKKTLAGDKNSVFGSAAVSVEATTGRILAIGQNTKFSEDKNVTDKDKSYSSLVYASDYTHGGSGGFETGSTFKIFTLLDWLEKGKSINEVLNGRNRVFDRFENSCEGDWVNTKKVKVPNDGKAGGGNGTPMQFTIRSLNSGFFAMAQQLDLCDIKKVATKLGVRVASTNEEVNMTTQFSILGSNNISPLAMAGAYATVANKGIYCTPHAIDRVTDADGNDLPIPASTCEQVLDPKVAATAAYAFRAVMTSGTGTGGNPGGKVPVIGKTGTHNKKQKWLVESSTNVATAVWAGNAKGDGDISRTYSNGGSVYFMPFKINKMIQGKANELYGGSKFPSPDSKLTRKVYTELPSVIGMDTSKAKKKLEDAGFTVKVGSEVDSGEPKGTIAEQSPGAGRVAGGATVTIRPSNGNGASIPGVNGLNYGAAEGALHGSGFSNLQQGTCTEDSSLHPGDRIATSTSPGEGTVANRNAAISINYKARHCGGFGP
ncbi:MAG: PASTA domain-containing protein [Rhodococcus sp.]|nr:PASTA domain-containing protein [Rhodococcus sp. (in: high G+C Gram-positive bacteria)]